MQGKNYEIPPSEWVRVVIVAGIGTILEWYDYYIYTQLSTTISAVFFPTTAPYASTMSYWAIFAVGFVSRPVGALVFGHIGDTIGRNTQMILSIMCMAISTVAIACLPTYDIGSYHAGIAAPILLAIFRFFQGFATAGEFGSAIIYISELTNTSHRCFYVSVLVCSVNIGLILAISLIMILENTISPYGMLVYGWRIPFALAFLTAILGFFLRRGLPEPQSFLEAARKEKEFFEKKKHSMLDVEESTENEPAGKELTTKASATEESGFLTRLRGHHHSKVPFLRVLYNNLAGVVIQILILCWLSGSFYTISSWLPATLRKRGIIAPLHVQGMTMLSAFFNAMARLGTGVALDKGLRVVYSFTVVVLVGVPMAYGVYYGSFASEAGAWCLMCLMQTLNGIGTSLLDLSCTRLYSPLERITGFAFAYNIAYGVVGGLSPIVISAIEASLSQSIQSFAAPFWLTGLGAISILGCWLVLAYMPRINQKFVGHIE